MKLMVDVFTVSPCVFLVMKAMRGKKFFKYFMNFMLAVDCEMMDDKIHEFFVFIQRLLFPVNSGERPLRQNDMSILDFIFSDLFSIRKTGSLSIMQHSESLEHRMKV